MVLSDSISELYRLDKQLEMDELCKKIIAQIESGQYEKLQHDIILHTNLSTYQHHCLAVNEEIADRIEKLYCQYVGFLDITKEEFSASFSRNYREKIFELVMTEFADKKFKLKERNDKDKNNKDGKLPDLEFEYNGKRYFLECTTRSASLMDEYAKRIMHFNVYFEVAKIFQNKCEELQKSRPLWEGKSWHYMLEQIWYELSEGQKKKISDNLGSLCERKDEATSPLWIFKKIQEWIYYNQYAYFYFKSFLSGETSAKLKDVFSHTSRSEDMPKYEKFLVKCIVQKILEKLGKLFFSCNVPVVLSISLATLPDQMLTAIAVDKIENISTLLLEELRSVATNDEYRKYWENIRTLSDKIKNLYAIIIDATAYNWFPDVMEKRYGAQFSNAYRNCYYVIYNASLSEQIESDPNIFDSLVERRFHLALSIQCPVVEEEAF